MIVGRGEVWSLRWVLNKILTNVQLLNDWRENDHRRGRNINMKSTLFFFYLGWPDQMSSEIHNRVLLIHREAKTPSGEFIFSPRIPGQLFWWNGPHWIFWHFGYLCASLWLLLLFWTVMGCSLFIPYNSDLQEILPLSPVKVKQVLGAVTCCHLFWSHVIMDERSWDLWESVVEVIQYWATIITIRVFNLCQ